MRRRRRVYQQSESRHGAGGHEKFRLDVQALSNKRVEEETWRSLSEVESKSRGGSGDDGEDDEHTENRAGDELA